MCDCIDITGAGTPGINGVYGGYSTDYNYDSTAVTASPSSGYIRFNNSNLSLVTHIYTSTSNASSIDVSAFIDSFANSSNYGLLRVYKSTDNTKFAYYTLTNVTTPGSGGRDLTVTYVGGSGSFTGGDNIVISFVPKGSTGSTGSNGSNGSNGANGANGTDGLYGGFSLPWKYETSTSAGATSGYLRLNNGTYSNVNTIYISTTNSDSVASSSFLTSLSNDGLYGYIKIAKKTDGTKFWMGKVSSATDSGLGYYILTVSYIFSNSSFSADDACFLTFTPGINITSAFLINGKLPSVAKDTTHGTIDSGTVIIPGTTGGDITILEDTLSAFNTTTGIWTCPATGYYDLTFTIFATQSGASMGTGFMLASIIDVATGNRRAYSTITLDTNMKESVLHASSVYNKITSGTQLELKFLNRSSLDITGNANGAGGDATQAFKIAIKRVA